MTGDASIAPVLTLEAREVTRVNGSWRVRWRIGNTGGGHVRLVAMRAPHGRFHADPEDLSIVVADTAAIEQTLRIEAAPGEEVEGVAVVFMAVVERQTWRALFRVRVLMRADGTPAPIVEGVVTEHLGPGEV